MSRAERRVLPPPPRITRVVRAAAGDFYYNSWRFLGANLIVGALLVGLLLVAVAFPPALLATPLLALPAAGTMRMAACLVRDGHTDFGDFAATLRRPRLVLPVAVVQCVAGIVLVGDVVIGGTMDAAVGTLLLVSALYGIVIGWAISAVAWPLLLDPVRDADPVRQRLRLAFIVLVAHPIRVGGVVVLAGILLALSAMAIAPFLTFTVALTWLGLARFILPAADRIEGRPTQVVEDDSPG